MIIPENILYIDAKNYTDDFKLYKDIKSKTIENIIAFCVDTRGYRLLSSSVVGSFLGFHRQKKKVIILLDKGGIVENILVLSSIASFFTLVYTEQQFDEEIKKIVENNQ